MIHNKKPIHIKLQFNNPSTSYNTIKHCWTENKDMPQLRQSPAYHQMALVVGKVATVLVCLTQYFYLPVCIILSLLHIHSSTYHWHYTMLVTYCNIR